MSRLQDYLSLSAALLEDLSATQTAAVHSEFHADTLTRRYKNVSFVIEATTNYITHSGSQTQERKLLK